MAVVPKSLQGVLWSVKTSSLDTLRDAPYIINQLLSYGSWNNLKWLFKTYPKNEIRKHFRENPIKIYTPSAFNFSKNVLLDLGDVNLPPECYVKTLPRRINK
ncbi:hypothetical protein KKB83_00965 [Patescibacteria group bacterium]|nr:hypothetical protein [Patescibacteria group bacterium]